MRRRFLGRAIAGQSAEDGRVFASVRPKEARGESGK